MKGDGKIYQHPKSRFLWMQYFYKGKRCRESSGETEPKKAARKLKDRLAEIRMDRTGKVDFVPNSQLRVRDLLDALEGDYKLREVKSPAVQSHLKPLRDALGNIRAKNLTAEMVDRYIGVRLQDRRKATVNRETQLLGQAFRLAIERKKLRTAPKIRRLSEKGNERSGFFEKPDFEALVEQLPDYLQDFTRFGFLTGWRKGEIASLVWSDLDMDARIMILRGQEAKNGHSRKVPLEGELWEIIERRCNARQNKQPDGTVGFSQHVFHREGKPIGDYRKAWASASKRASLEGRLFHDFRRTAARNMRRAGVSEKVIMDLLGHRTTSMFLRYSITDETDLREAVQKTQQYLKTVSSERTVVPFKKVAAGGQGK